MKKYLIALLALAVMTTVTSTANAGDPQACRNQLINVLSELGMTLEDLAVSSKVDTFKTEAKAREKWWQFKEICNSRSPKECKSCSCGTPPFPLSDCMFSCKCCWGDNLCQEN